MSLSAGSVRRPVTVTMAVLAVSVFGVIAARRLPVELLPNLAYPSLTIQTNYSDAAPVSVEQFVSRPIEEAVGVIPGVRDLRSVSRAGRSEVVLEFDWSQDMDLAALDVREKLGLVELPREAERPRVLRFDPSLEPVARLALRGERPLDELHELADRWIKPRLEAVSGIAAAKVRGGLQTEVQVQANADRLGALGMTLGDLALALEQENVNLPGGVLRDWGAVYLIRTLHEFSSIQQIGRTIVRETSEGRVRLEDVATVVEGHREREQITLLGGREVVELALHREGSANTMRVSDDLRSELARLREKLPQDLELTILNDQSRYIAAAVEQVWSAALLGGLLAILVVYFFLRDPLSTLTIALTIPVSVVATFLPMQQAGVTLNIMSLGGLALGVGMLVDNAIVVLEAIDRRRGLGEPRAQAAARGAEDVAGAVTAATLTTVSVFLPIVFVTGVAGQLFNDLAVTVCFSLLASLLASLTLIPALAAFDPAAMVRRARETLFAWDERGEEEEEEREEEQGDNDHDHDHDHERERERGESYPEGTIRIGGMALVPLGAGRVARGLTWVLLPVRLLLVGAALLGIGLAWCGAWAFHVLSWPAARALDGVGRMYPRLLRGALRWRWLVTTGTALAFLGSLAAIQHVGTNLVPDMAQGEFAFRVRLPEGTPLATTAQVVHQLEAPLLKDPRFARVFALVGSLPSTASGRRTHGENLAQVNFVLPEGADRDAEQEAQRRVREVLAAFPSLEAELVQPQVLTIEPPVVVQVFAEDLKILDTAAELVAKELRRLPLLSDVTTSAEPGSPEIRVELERDRAASLRIDAAQVARSLRRQVRGQVVGRFRKAERRVDIRLRASERFRKRAEDVAALRIRLPGSADAPAGVVLPVSALAKVDIDRGPAALHHASGARVARITASSPAADLGAAIEQVRSALAGLDLPAGAVAELTGQDEELKESFGSLRLALALAIFLVFVVMAIQFESLRHPFVILLSVPMGLVGVVLALLLTRTPLGVLVFIGCVMLAGIVVNNAIVLVDAINRRVRGGEDLMPAILGGGQERLRPILMTTTTTILALLPMALGWGAGSELRAPLANTVIGGLSGATLLTLLVIPCVYRSLAGSPAREEPAA